MKKTTLLFSIILLTLIVIFSSLFIRNKKDTPSAESHGITAQDAIDIAQKQLDGNGVETITNYKHPDIEKVVFQTPPPIYLLDETVDVVGKNLYKITFTTELDGLLGPIVFYIDEQSGTVIGTDFRE